MPARRERARKRRVAAARRRSPEKPSLACVVPLEVHPGEVIVASRPADQPRALDVVGKRRCRRRDLALASRFQLDPRLARAAVPATRGSTRARASRSRFEASTRSVRRTRPNLPSLPQRSARAPPAARANVRLSGDQRQPRRDGAPGTLLSNRGRLDLEVACARAERPTNCPDTRSLDLATTSYTLPLPG